MKNSVDLLKEKGLSRTQSRILIIDHFLRSHGPVAAPDLKKLEGLEGVSESTIYRNLAKLEEGGILQSVASKNDFQMYELVHSGSCHHHIVCTICKQMQCLEECTIGPALEHLADQVGFQLRGHSLELFGTCASCR